MSCSMRTDRPRRRLGGRRRPQITPTPWRSVVVLLGLLCAPHASAVGATATSETSPPIVLLIVDTLRSDRLPAYGYRDVATPAIDSLRRSSTLFAHAYSPVPLTLPAHASLFTGSLPSEHGVRDNSGYVLPDEAETLAELLSGAGYRTGGFVSSFVLRGATGIAQGFEHYDGLDVAGGRQTGAADRAGQVTVDAALEWLASAGDQPFFLFVHLYEPHAPYAAPEPYASRYDDPYDAEVAQSDALVGSVITALRRSGRFDESLIFLASDHGEGLGDHGEEEHGILLYRETLQVPLLMKLPGQRAARTEETAVALQDVFGTVCRIASLPCAQPTDLRAPLAGRQLLAETYYPELRLGWSRLASVIEDRHHYIEGIRGELFDLANDPEELHDIASDDRRTLRRLQARVAELPKRLAARPQTVTDEQAERLRSLGYLSGGAAASAGGRPGPDPRSKIHELGKYFEAVRLLRSGAADDARTKLLEVLDSNPRFLDAWQMLALSEVERNNPEGAYLAYRRAFEVSGGSQVLVEPLVLVTMELGKYEEALPLLELAIGATREREWLRIARTEALLATGDVDAALTSARENLEVLPESRQLRRQFETVLERFEAR